jgi:hypothetical protein
MKKVYEVNLSYDERKQLRTSKDLSKKAPYFQLRNKRTAQYTENDAELILGDIRYQEGQGVKTALINSGVKLHSLDKLDANDSTANAFKAKNNVAVTGFCLSKYPSVENALPILLIDEMLEKGAVDSAAIVYPNLMYRVRGFHTTDQLDKALNITAGIFGDKIGEQVALMPDDNPSVFNAKSLMTVLISPHIGNALTERKYKEKNKTPNFFDYLRGPFSGADVLLAGAGLNKNPTIVADTLDSEIIYPTYVGGRSVKLKSNISMEPEAVMVTTLPRLDGKTAINSYEVSGADEVLNPLEPGEIMKKIASAKKVYNIPEICPAFNNLFPIADRDASENAYYDYKEQTVSEMIRSAEKNLSRILSEGKRTISEYGGAERMIEKSLEMMDLDSTYQGLLEQAKSYGK